MLQITGTTQLRVQYYGQSINQCYTCSYGSDLLYVS